MVVYKLNPWKQNLVCKQCTCIYVHVRVYVHTGMYTCTCTCMCVCMCTCMQFLINSISKVKMACILWTLISGVLTLNIPALPSSLNPFRNLSPTMLEGSVLARPIPKGTVPFGAANVPFGAGPKPKCALWCFSSHLNCLYVRVTVLCWKQALA